MGIDMQVVTKSSIIWSRSMNSIIYIVGLVVVVLFIAGFLGLR